MTRRQFIRRSAGAAALAGLGVGGLAACGEESGGARGESGEAITIEYWHINSETFGRPALQKLIRRFNEENPDVSVRERFQPDSYTGLLENAQTAQAAGTPPDVAQVGYDSINYVASNFRYASAQELAAEYSGEGFFGNWQDNLLELGQVDGEQVAVPYPLSVVITYYNADMLSEAGLDPNAPPGTWEEWTRAAETIKEQLDKPGLCFAVANGITGYAQG